MRHHSIRAIGATGLAGLLLLGAASVADARGVEAREARQRTRIERGAADGSLTRRETHRLAHEQVRIERTERRLRHDDGRLGPRERARLDAMQDRASAHIWRARHNLRTR